jgi:hypothetical protein
MLVVLVMALAFVLAVLVTVMGTFFMYAIVGRPFMFVIHVGRSLSI